MPFDRRVVRLHRLRRCLLIAAVIVPAAVSAVLMSGVVPTRFGAAAQASEKISFAESRVVVHAAGGDHAFTVEMAVDDAQRALGLMFRRELAPDHGMLFDFGRDSFISMWMRNTFISLDMLFITSNGRISFIREHTTPQSLETIEAPERNRAVLELAAGTAARLGLKVGDRVDHEIFGRPATPGG